MNISWIFIKFSDDIENCMMKWFDSVLQNECPLFENVIVISRHNRAV